MYASPRKVCAGLCASLLTDFIPKPAKERGDLIFSPYEANTTQRKQPMSMLNQKFLEDIEKMK